MPGVSTAQAIAVRNLISQQPSGQQEILWRLLELQERYKWVHSLYILSFTLFFRKRLKKVKEDIDREYAKYPKEVKLLKKMYELP